MLPTKEENPNGLHQRYNVTKCDGGPVDPNAVYFVLRIDHNGDDPIHIAACRCALAEYIHAMQLAKHLPKLTVDLEQLLFQTSK